MAFTLTEMAHNLMTRDDPMNPDLDPRRRWLALLAALLLATFTAQTAFAQTAGGVVISAGFTRDTHGNFPTTQNLVVEGLTGSYGVTLQTAPSGNVTVTPSISVGAGAVSISPATLTFTPANYNTAQSVTVTGIVDADAIDNPFTITHAASGASVSVGPAVSGLAPERPILRWDHAGDTATFGEGDDIGTGVPLRVQVMNPPMRRVTYETPGYTGGDFLYFNTQGISGSATYAGGSGGGVDAYGLSGLGSFQFGLHAEHSNDFVPVVQSMGLENDAYPEGNEQFTVRLTAINSFNNPSNPVANVAIVNETLTVNIIDDDRIGAVLAIARTPATLRENQRGSYDVALASDWLQPGGSVVVTGSAAMDDDGDTLARLTPDTLTFTKANWNTVQQVTVTALPDEDGDTDSVVISQRVRFGEDVGPAADFTLTVQEAPLLRFTTPTALRLAEGSATDVCLEVVRSPADINLATSPLNILLTPDNAGFTNGATSDHYTLPAPMATGGTLPPLTAVGTPQCVSVSTIDGGMGTADLSFRLTPSLASGPGFSDPGVVTITILDNDRAAMRFSEQTLLLTEGGSAFYTAQLNSVPGSNVVITPTLSAAATNPFVPVTLAPATLTFTTTNWNTPQTVSLTAGENNGGFDTELRTITNTPGGGDIAGYGALSADSIPLTVLNNDELIFSNTGAFTLNEGGDPATVVLEMKSVPTGTVTLTPTGLPAAGAAGALTLDPPTVEFTVADWNVPRTVLVSAAHDFDNDNDTTTLAYASSGGGSGGDYATVAPITASIADDDEAALALNPDNNLNVIASTTGAYTVALATQPRGEVTVTPANDNPAAVTLNTGNADGTLVFTAANWNTPQPVTATAAGEDTIDDIATITHTVAGYGTYDGLPVPAITVTVVGQPRIVIEPARLTVTEGGVSHHTVRLGARPLLDNVIISQFNTNQRNLNRYHEANENTFARNFTVGSNLIFSPDNWHIPVSRSITTAQDANSADSYYQIRYEPTGSSTVPGRREYYGAAPAVFAMPIADDDPLEEQGITVSASGITINEGGAGTYTVSLTGVPPHGIPGFSVQPPLDSAGAVIVTPSTTNDPDSRLSVHPSTAALTFTAATWNTPQTVSVVSADNDEDTRRSDTVSITHELSGGIRTLAFADGVTDVFPEDHATSAGQVIGIDEPITIPTTDPRALRYGSAFDATTADVAVTIYNNDPNVVISTEPLRVNEGGASPTYTVELLGIPDGVATITPVYVAATPLAGGYLTIPEVRFTADNWQVTQTVGVTALDNGEGGEADRTFTVTHSATNYADDDIGEQQFTVTVVDDDVVGVLVSASALSVDEGEFTTYTVMLGDIPSEDVTITPAVAPDDSDLTLTPSGALVFTDATWNTPQVVTVAAAHDTARDTGEGGANNDDSANISHTAVSAGDDYNGASVGSVAVTVADDDVADVIAGGALFTADDKSVLEGDSASSLIYTIVLNSLPAADVVITPSASLSGELTLPDALTFTDANWNVRQTVSITAAPGRDDSLEHVTLMVTHSVSGGDYNSETIPPVEVTITNDTPGVLVGGVDNLRIDEGGETDTYTIVLASDPRGLVTVTPAHGPGTGAADLTFTPAALVFDATNWAMAQMVTVGTVGDVIDDGDLTQTITHAISGAATATGESYEGIDATQPAGPFNVTIIENDVAEILVLTEAGGPLPNSGLNIINADGTLIYGVALATQPAGDGTVVVSLTASQGEITPATLTFTAASQDDWLTRKLVTVTVAERQADDFTLQVRHTSSSDDAPEYAALSTSVGVGVASPRITSTRALSTGSGGGGSGTPADPRVVRPGETLTIELDINTHLEGNLTVAFEVVRMDGDTPTYLPTLNPSPVVFMPEANPTGANLPLGALDVVIPAGAAGDYEIRMTSLTGPGATVGGVPIPMPAGAFYTIRVPGPDLTFTPESITAAANFGEGTDMDYSVRLSELPTGDVTVMIASSNADNLMVSDATLTFSDSNWNQPVQVALMSPPDAPASTAGSFTIAHTASGANYGDVTKAFQVTVNQAGITFAPLGFSLNPGESKIYTIVLETPPSADVLVTPSTVPPDVVSVTLTPASALTFTAIAGNWSMPQTVTVTATADFTPDTYPDGIGLSHAVTGASNYADYFRNGVLTMPEFMVRPSPTAALDELNRVILPEIVRAMADQQTGAIARRIRQAKLGEGGGGGASLSFAGQSTLEGIAATQADAAVNTDGIDFQRALGGSEFVMPLSAAADGNGGFGVGAGGGGFGAGGLHNATFWGGGDHRELGGESGALDWEGTLFSVNLGFDARVRPDLLTGLLVTHSEADIEFAGGINGGGDYDLTHTGVNPYLGWSARDGRLDMWATAGFGSGEIEATFDNDPDESYKTDISTQMLGIGGSGTWFHFGKTEMRLKAEAFVTKTDVDKTDDYMAREVDANRLRFALEGNHKQTTATGGELNRNAEIGIRSDTGDGETGSGIEVGGGIQYTNQARGVTLSGNARALFGHSGEYDDWGISAHLNLSPGKDGQGLSLSLTPTYGNSSSRMSEVWDEGIRSSAGAGSSSSASTLGSGSTTADSKLEANLRANLSYGLTTHPITPYTQLTLGKTQSYRLGLKYQKTPHLNLNLYTNHQNNQGVWLKGEVEF